MQKIALITDSAADLTKEQIKEYNIHIAPFRIIYSDKEYEDTITITAEQVYENIEKEVPTTSLPSVEGLEILLQKLEAEGYTHVISVNISCHLSGTANSIRLLLEEHPKLTSFVYDTKTLTVAQGAIVIEAAKMIKNGESFENIVAKLPELRKNLHVYFTLNTLEYLKRGGRIGRVSGTIGELLNLKPIILVNDDGIYDTYAKLRGRKQSLKKLIEILDSYLEKSYCNVWIVDGYAKEEGNEIYEQLKTHPKIKNIHRQILGPALGVHTGPGLIGIAIQEVH